MIAKRRRKRRKKGRYKRGIHSSPKSAAECRYRSGWELVYLHHLDNDPNVVSYFYEGVCIPYTSNKRSGKQRKYYPDVLIERADGSKTLVEIKPSKKLVQATVQKKLEAARAWCSEHGVTLEIITEVELRGLGLL